MRTTIGLRCCFFEGALLAVLLTTGCATREVSPNTSTPVATEARVDIDRSQPLTTIGWIGIQGSSIDTERKSGEGLNLLS